MKIYRNGQEFELTYEELRAAYLEMDKIYRLEDAEQQFLSYIEYEEYGSDRHGLRNFLPSMDSSRKRQSIRNLNLSFSRNCRTILSAVRAATFRKTICGGKLSMSR